MNFIFMNEKNPGKRVAEIRWQDGKFTHKKKSANTRTYATRRLTFQSLEPNYS